MNKLALFAVVMAVLTLSACNTVSGFGKDLEHLGGKIDKSSGK
ncbi:entericidin A/B family lipoprotein [Chitinilyticum piscinae]|uniref:Entericidin A/B family lipoprotein n=1 Tax=Chitinilyticum piscinae TaxID=2866724 RepID=A0A8J7K233_9NEIS|nr:entericidin A/B family lipoprotein [Chitinilyticum piscinae]MBE9609472.1 entericidin A/B family lipoprotein [Chitinilyticum piscinae]